MLRLRCVLLLCGSLLLSCGDKAAQTGTDDSGSTDDTAGSGDDGTGDDGGEGPDGQALFEASCSSCHASDGRGTSNKTDLQSVFEQHSDAEILSLVMSHKGDVVTEAEAEAIIDYCRTALFPE